MFVVDSDSNTNIEHNALISASFKPLKSPLNTISVSNMQSDDDTRFKANLPLSCNNPLSSI